MSQRDRELESRLVTAERERLGLKADLDAQRYVLTEMQSLAAEAARIFESIPGIERNGRDIGIRIDAWKKALASAQPAAPARAEAESFDLTTPEGAVDAYNAMGERCLTRTEAEQAVLDALTELSTDVLDWWRVHGSVCQSNIAVAELARRGLK